jgi:hypothetical protein
MEQTKDTTDGVVFNFEKNIGKKNPDVEKIPTFSGPHDWLASMYKAKNKKNLRLQETIAKNSIRILLDSVISDKMDATHCGMMQYIYHAWAKELGVVLKPDMLFYTILSELKNQIINYPSKYRHLFTDSDKKENVVIVNLSIDKLMDVLNDLIPCKELFELVTKTSFSTEPQHYKQILGITMADMGTPYYSYSSTRCGIPKILIQGTKVDWNKLTETVLQFRQIFEGCCKVLTHYLTIVYDTVTKLIDAAFNKNDGSYFENIFTYCQNPHCGSGHLPVVLDGWIRTLYIGNYYNDKFYGYEDFIDRYRSHFNCLPYDDKDDPNNIKYYFYACGLSSSKINNGYLYPEYNIAHCELVHPEKETIFNVLAQNN